MLNSRVAASKDRVLKSCVTASREKTLKSCVMALIEKVQESGITAQRGSKSCVTVEKKRKL